MKLHLPKMLTAALFAAFVTTAAQAAEPQHLGQILTWGGDAADASAGTYWVTTFDPVAYGDSYKGWNDTATGVKHLIYNQMGDRNTLRFSSDKGSGQKSIEYTFNYFTVGGFFVDSGAEGFDIHTKKDTDRSFYLGTTVSGDTGYSTIKESFLLKQTSTNANSIIHLQGNQVFDVESGKVFTIQQSNSNTLDFDTQLTVQGGGTVAFDGTSAVAMTGNASLTVATGSTVTFSQDVTGLATTITNNGRVTFKSDTVTLGDLGAFDKEGVYEDYTEESTGNGFAGTLVYTIIKGTGTTNLAKVNYGEQTGVALEDGKITVSAATDYTKYYINTDDAVVSLKSAGEYAAGHDAMISTVYVTGANDTLNVDANFNGRVDVSGTGAVINIAEGNVFSGTLTGGILAGEGTYALAPGSTSMGSIAYDTESWRGIVKVSGVGSYAGIDLNSFGQAGSKVEMAGITGYFPSVSTEFLPGLVLSGSGITLNDGFSTSAGAPTAYTFAGGVSGAGNMTFSHKNGTKSNVTQNLYFTGDVSQWSGSLSVVAGFTVTAHYSGEALTVGSTISRTNGTLHVDVQAGSNVTFNGAITNASSLTVQEGATATLKAASSIGTLTSTGALTVNAGEGTVSFTGASHTIGKTITLAGGTLSLAGAYNLDAMEPTEYDDEYVGPEEGVAAGSGFHKVSGSVQVVTIDNGTLSLAEGATFSYQEASVTVDDKTGKGTFGGVDLTTLWVNGTDPVSYDAAQEYAEQKAPGTIVSTVRLNYDGATITMDRAGASVALVLSEDEEVTSGTVYATEDTTISGITGWSGKELVIDGTSTVTTGALTLDNDNTKLTVVAGAKLDIAGNNHNLTLQHGLATIEGTVTIAHELDLSKGSTSDAVLVIGSTGDVTATDGLWLRGGHHFTILDEGRFTVKGLTFVGQGEDSTISYNDVATKDGNYATTGDGKDKFVITNMTILANQDVTIANTLENSTVVTGDHAVTLNTDATKVIVSDGGTFTKGAGVTVEDITVKGSGTIAGNVEVSEVGITVGSVAAFVQGLPADSGVTFSNEDAHTPITVENIGEDTIHYDGIGQVDAKVTADNLVFFMADGPATVDNCVSVGSVQNLYSDGALTLTNVDTDTLRKVEAVMSDVVLENVQSVDLQELLISGATVAVYQGDTESAEGMVNITETLTAGGGTLLANLTLVGTDGHVSLDLSDITAQEGWAALTLGSQFGIAEGTLVTLDAVTISALEGLRIGDSLDLIQALSPDDQLTYLNEAYDGMWFDALFERVTGVEGDYLVYATGESFGLTKVSNTPEPTTGTLSLLALAALAARRRKH